jgi:hypothetical protein
MVLIGTESLDFIVDAAALNLTIGIRNRSGSIENGPFCLRRRFLPTKETLVFSFSLSRQKNY